MRRPDIRPPEDGRSDCDAAGAGPRQPGSGRQQARGREAASPSA
ncbi:MAG: hypothetical protein OXG81_14155 [Acidobacteria bacterium]|nr:hypothetical protein [Acidobacteriota bacterium]